MFVSGYTYVKRSKTPPALPIYWFSSNLEGFNLRIYSRMLERFVTHVQHSTIPRTTYFSDKEMGMASSSLSEPLLTIPFQINAKTLLANTRAFVTGDYLNGLRKNRVPQPQSSRPPPTFLSMRNHTGQDSTGSHNTLSSSTIREQQARFPSDDSAHRKDGASMPADSSPQADPEVMSAILSKSLSQKDGPDGLSQAVDDMNIKGEDDVFTAARKEAAELVWRHQNSGVPFRLKSSTEESIWPEGSKINAEGNCPSRTSPSEDDSTGQMISSDVGRPQFLDHCEHQERTPRRRSSQRHSYTLSIIQPIDSNSGSDIVRKGDHSNLQSASSEPAEHTKPSMKQEQEKEPCAFPSNGDGRTASFRKNPFARPRSTKTDVKSPPDGEQLQTKAVDRVEIQRNPPSQTRNPNYISNSDLHAIEVSSPDTDDLTGAEFPDKKYREGKEIRNDDMRAATSMKLKDRSPNLPSPTFVSDSPGRPIVSFQEHWTPPVSPHQEQESDGATVRSWQSTVHASLKDQASVVPSQNAQISHEHAALGKHHLDTHRKPKKLDGEPHTELPSSSEPPTDMPVLNLPESPPEMSTELGENVPRGSPGAKRTHVCKGTSCSPPIHERSSDWASDRAQRSRPSRPSNSRESTSKGSLVSQFGTPFNKSTILCAQCALPIQGRIITAAGTRLHPGCFKCFQCSQGLECVEFFPEPLDKRETRLDRIQRRIAGEEVECADSMTEADDGDDGPRFFCALDFHEFFSPRCKSCKTPIEGEVIVACGAEWHVGHFFCAQCGDVSVALSSAKVPSCRARANICLQPFDRTKPFVEKDGHAWCVNCHTNRYSAKCRKCRRPVIETVVKALGAEWHEACFCCTVRKTYHRLTQRRGVLLIFQAGMRSPIYRWALLSERLESRPSLRRLRGTEAQGVEKTTWRFKNRECPLGSRSRETKVDEVSYISRKVLAFDQDL